MIFQWDPSVPLVVDDNIELPQLALVQNHTADCKLCVCVCACNIKIKRYLPHLNHFE